MDKLEGTLDIETGRNGHRGRNTTWQMPLAVSLLVGLLGSATTYGLTTGSNNQRMTDLERRVTEQSARLDAQATQIAALQTSSAVYQAQYAEIIRRLDELSNKIERQKGG